LSALLLASRVRKARRAGRCAMCPGPVRIGERIGYVPRVGWSHIACIIEQQRQGDDLTRSRPEETR
jgi:hypothetical protein